MTDSMDMDAPARRREEALAAGLAGLRDPADRHRQVGRVAPEQLGLSTRARELDQTAETISFLVEADMPWEYAAPHDLEEVRDVLDNHVRHAQNLTQGSADPALRREGEQAMAQYQAYRDAVEEMRVEALDRRASTTQSGCRGTSTGGSTSS